MTPAKKKVGCRVSTNEEEVDELVMGVAYLPSQHPMHYVVIPAVKEANEDQQKEGRKKWRRV